MEDRLTQKTNESVVNIDFQHDRRPRTGDVIQSCAPAKGAHRFPKSDLIPDTCKVARRNLCARASEAVHVNVERLTERRRCDSQRERYGRAPIHFFVGSSCTRPCPTAHVLSCVASVSPTEPENARSLHENRPTARRRPKSRWPTHSCHAVNGRVLTGS